jgi:SPP1 gp7 family putative phage head morphogenesis protein
MIARTEIQIAQNEGRQEGWNQAAEQGYVDVEAQKMWVIAEDERTCDICVELDGEIVPWNETFSSGHETPGRVHPNCRCTMVIIPPDRRSK